MQDIISETVQDLRRMITLTPIRHGILSVIGIRDTGGAL
jgi:hypothetical protein